MDSAGSTERAAPERSLGWAFTVVEACAFAAAAAVFATTLGWDDWSLGRLAAIIAFVTLSELAADQGGSENVGVSGTLLGLLLAAVLLGGGVGALVGVVAVAIGWFRRREPPATFVNNLVTYAWFPLAAGIFFHAVTHGLRAGPSAVTYYFLV